MNDKYLAIVHVIDSAPDAAVSLAGEDKKCFLADIITAANQDEADATVDTLMTALARERFSESTEAFRLYGTAIPLDVILWKAAELDSPI